MTKTFVFDTPKSNSKKSGFLGFLELDIRPPFCNTPYITKLEESPYEKETPLDNDDPGVPFDFAWECLRFRDWFDFVEGDDN